MNLRTVGAWTTAGVAMWASLGALDVTGGPAGVERIAMLPGLGTLAASMALALVLGALLKVRIAADPAPRAATAAKPPREHGTGDSFLPLYALVVLVLPYLPWLPDWMPVLRVFAGPGKLLVWLIVASQVVWAILGAGRGRRVAVRVRAWSPWRGFAMAFVAAFLAYGAASVVLVPSGLFPGGDEPHYLILMQSLLKDHDLRIANNHAQRDYEAYFTEGDLEPHAIAPGKDGEIYSVHPVGLPLLAAPAFAVAGYRGVVLLILALAAAASALAWSWVRWTTGSVSAATFAWSAVGLSLPVLGAAGTVFPEVPASLAMVTAAILAIDGRADAVARGAAPARFPLLSAGGLGLAAGVLPWLHVRYAPASALLLAFGAWRFWRESEGGARLVRVGVAAGLYAASVLAWLGYFYLIWGSPWPSAPYGGAGGTQMSLAALARGIPGVLLDQEYGVLSCAPALVLGLAGFVTMWRAGGRVRTAAVQLALVLAAVLGMAGGFQMWWGGSALPGRLILSGLLLLTVPCAWAFRASADRPERRAAYRLLLLVGIGISLACVLALDGRLLVLERNGVSPFLAWLSPDWHLWAYFSDFILQPTWVGLTQAAVWIAAAMASAWLVGRVATRASAARGSSRTGRGLAFLRVDAGALLTLLLATLAIPAVLGAQLKPNPAPDARERIQMLDGFDPRERPIGVRYAPLSLVAADDVPRLFEVSARPGSRTAPQPTPVMLNARFALPAGRYTVELHPRPGLAPGTALSGQLALRVGRTGGTPTTWTVAAEPGRPWTAEFDLPVDVNFVGFRASDDLDHQVGLLRVRPQSVVPSLDRIAAYDVLGSWAIGPFVFLFHDDQSYPEPDGFWVRGGSRAIISIVSRTGRVTTRFRLRLRSGVANALSIDTPDQHWTLQLAADEVRDLDMAPTALDGTLRVIISPATGFRPSDRDPANGDRRFLGCWVQIIE